ncbi:class I SAM-dependent methyltransferase [Yinghuangia aomiensis]|uniref:Class I SAM-dependent methyltransferase n=1 Tax=Yinghuangia aomiensis TaxID=676205 RepID=A0ABP9I5D0_9ACTN
MTSADHLIRTRELPATRRQAPWPSPADGDRIDAPRPGTEARTPLGPYETALREGGVLYMRRADGRRQALDLARWKAPADAADLSLVARCTGPTLDIGCGPGRLTAALVRRGLPTLGIDLAREAVRATTRAGAACLRKSVFDPLPREGRWGTALLADGNIGIGGDPAALLGRSAALLRTGGVLLVETNPDDPQAHERFAVRVEDTHGRRGAAFRWATVGAAALALLAPAQGFIVHEAWDHSGRAFTSLRRT